MPEKSRFQAVSAAADTDHEYHELAAKSKETVSDSLTGLDNQVSDLRDSLEKLRCQLSDVLYPADGAPLKAVNVEGDCAILNRLSAIHITVSLCSDIVSDVQDRLAL